MSHSINLTDDVRQDPSEPEDAPAYLVFSNDGTYSERLFHELQDAQDFAIQCEEREVDWDGSPWPVYPLWAGETIQ